MVHGRITPLLGLLAAAAILAQTGARVSGRVANENGVPLAGARLIFHAVDAEQPDAFAYTDPAGDFTLTLSTAGKYSVTVERKGYFPLRDHPITLAEGVNQADFTLNRIREVIESVEVVAAPSPINMETTESQTTVTGTEITNIPYPTSNNLRNALRIMPGVVQDRRGQLHINGGAESQATYTLDGFNVSDPLTGRFESRLSVEAVQSVDVTSGLISAEYGKGSAGVMAIHGRTGDDRFRTSATNFFPGVEYRKGIYIGNWTPRFNVSGPIKKGRAWFSNSFDALYVNTVVDELPKGEDRSDSWLFSNHLNTQFNLTPANILYAGFLTNIRLAPRYGLGVLDPRETTVDRRRRQWFFHIKDQAYLTNDILIEVGYAANRTFGREIPQGTEMYQITPDGRRGNFFLDATRKSSRDQILANVFLPSFELLGEHRLKVGVDLDRLRYWQDARRTGYENYGLDFIRTRRTVFGGSGLAEITNYEASVYLQDSWRVRPGLLVEAGLRGDWDQILHYWNASPRVAVAWQPPGLERTKISGGVGIIYDATNLRIFTRPMDQYSMTTYFDDQGTPEHGPAYTVFTIRNPRPARPRYHNWSAGLEQEFPHGVHGRVEYLRRRGSYGFTYVNTLGRGASPPSELVRRFSGPEFDAVYNLTNDRRDEYDHYRFTVRQTIKRKYEWLVSYTRSRARSNAVVDANIDDPIVVSENVGPMPWDAPNRLVSWAYLPTPWKKWAVAYMAEWRSGFPFSIVDEDGHVIGDVNRFRLPAFFELNLHLERRFVLKNQLWAFRMGCNNVTNRSNPNTVNNNVSSRHFLQYYGGADRSFNFRIRWLGKTGK